MTDENGMRDGGQSTEEMTCDCELPGEGRVAELCAHMPSDPTLCELAEFFRIFGDPTRLRILFALDRTELCVCELSALLATTKSAVSHQLKLLRQSALVRYRKCGKNVYYTLADDHVRDIIEKALEHVQE